MAEPVAPAPPPRMSIPLTGNPIADIVARGIEALPLVIEAIRAIAAPDSGPIIDRLQELLGDRSALDRIAEEQERKARAALGGE